MTAPGRGLVKALAPVAVVAAVLAVPAAASAAPQRMSLACEGSDLVVERANGASWWGADGSVWTTRYLRVVDDGGSYEKHYGGKAGDVVLCEADHVTPDYSSRWTVELVRAS